MSWMYDLLSVRGASNVIGAIEIATAALMALRARGHRRLTNLNEVSIRIAHVASRFRSRVKGATKLSVTHGSMTVRSGQVEAAIKTSFELAVERGHARIEEWQDLREQRAGDFLHRIEPEIGVEYARPGNACRAAAIGAGKLVAVERQAPLVWRPGNWSKLLESAGLAVRISWTLRSPI